MTEQEISNNQLNENMIPWLEIHQKYKILKRLIEWASISSRQIEYDLIVVYQFYRSASIVK
jgi:mRNA-degrading endonuclease YafQ of YafQ-DinJ toxin-antitoxin module